NCARVWLLPPALEARRSVAFEPSTSTQYRLPCGASSARNEASTLETTIWTLPPSNAARRITPDPVEGRAIQYNWLALASISKSRKERCGSLNRSVLPEPSSPARRSTEPEASSVHQYKRPAATATPDTSCCPLTSDASAPPGARRWMLPSN